VESAGAPYIVRPSSIKAMANLACGQFFASVERLCSRSLTTKNYGIKAMEEMVAKHNTALSETATEASESVLQSNHMTLENTTQVTGPVEEDLEELLQ